MKKRLVDYLCVLIVIAIMLGVIVALFSAKPQKEEPVADTLKSKSGDNIYNVLFLGRDNAAGLCDVIMLGSINTDNGNISFMQIPRDTYFNYTEASYKKLNGIYNSLGSASAVAKDLGKALGIDIDFYLCLGLDAVEKMVDAVGGVDINVPFDMNYNDPAQNLQINLKAGNQTLSGQQAVEFIRYRAGYVTGDLGRIDAQKLFLNAFAKKVVALANPLALYNVFKLICDNGETNVTSNDFISIGLKCMQAKTGKVSYMTAPGEAIQSEKSGAWYYILSADSMTELLSSCFDSKESFDKEYKFVDNSNKSFYDIYNKKCEIRIYTADDIENNKININ